MPIYSYECPNGHESEDLRRVANREDPHSCPQCGEPAKAVITAVAFDNLGMGCDSGFPTFYDKWAKLQTSKNSGKSWDSNNRRYGGDWEKQK
jgi:putative FmdB family regulatory protein